MMEVMTENGKDAVLGLLGRILSDFCYVLIDPRIHFQK